MNPYYKLYVYFLGPKILTEIETLKAKLEKGVNDDDEAGLSWAELNNRDEFFNNCVV